MNTTQAKDLMRAVADAAGCPLEIDPDNELAVLTAAAWLAREPRPGMDINKGLLVLGHVGTGKTMLMKTVRKAMEQAYGHQFGIISCADIVRRFVDDGYDGVDKWMTARHVCFDDLGTESEAVHYGKRTNLLAEIIEARYDRFMQPGVVCWTHITTNLGVDQIAKQYGGRVASRLQHMTNAVALGASASSIDRRRAAQAPAQPPKPMDADNVYTAVHPDLASKLLESLRPGLKSMRVIRPDRPMPAGPSREQELVAFAAGLENYTENELRHARRQILRNNSEIASEPWIALIDQELKRRNPSTDNDPASLANAGVENNERA